MRMDKPNLTILKQTNKALIQLVYKSKEQRATFLASKMEVKYPTAMRWVCLKSWPRDWMGLIDVMRDAGINAPWLWGENVPATLKEVEDEKDFLALIRKLPEDEFKSVGKALELINHEETKSEAMAILTQSTEGVISRADTFKEIDKLWSHSKPALN